MTISLNCPSCERRLKVPDKAAGRRLKCPSCETPVQIPAAQAAVEGAEEFHDDDMDSQEYSPALPARRRNKSKSKQAQVVPKPEKSSLSPGIVAAAGGGGGLLLGALMMWLFSGSTPRPTPAEPPPAVVSNPAGVRQADGQLVAASDQAADHHAYPPNSLGVDEPASAPATGSSAPVAQQPAQAPVNVTVTATTGALVQLSGAESPKAALQQMLATLQKHEYENFVVNYSPIDEFRRYRDSSSRAETLQQFPGADLLALLQQLDSAVPVVDESGMVATIRQVVEPSPATAGPAGEGYGGDLPSVLDAAIADIENGRLKDFVTKIFPPEALQAMQAGPTGATRLDAINAKSPVIQTMLLDLKTLKSETPVIEGDVAEYTVKPLTGTVRPNPRGLQPPDRRIRFSKINGHWRFYAGVSATQIAAAQSGTNVKEVRLERIGPGWRLQSMPRM